MTCAIIQCGDHFENQSRILPLALHLADAGIKPVILLYSKTASRLFEHHAIDSIYLDDYRKNADLVIAAFPFDYEKVFKIERARAYYRFNTPGKVKREKYKIDRDYSAINCIFDEYAPDYVFIWNGFTGNVANLLRVTCDSRPVLGTWYMERAFFNNSLFIDPDGVNAAASIAKYFDSSYDEREIPSDYVEGKGIAELQNVDAIRPFDSNYIFLPLQVQTDTNSILYSPCIKKMRALVIAIADAVSYVNQNLGRDLKVIVRQHPEEVDKNLNLPLHPIVYYRNEGSIRDWCFHSEAVVNVNSTVGMEALYLGKEVVSFGRSLYSHDRIQTAASPDNINKELLSLLGTNETAFDKVQIESFFKFLFFYNTCNLDNFPDCVREKIGAETESQEKRFSQDGVFKDFLTGKDNIKVACYLSHKTRLNLTYRKSEVEVSPDLYRKMFQSRYKYCGPIHFELLNEPAVAKEYDLVIRDRYHDDLSIQHDIILDEYLSLTSK